MTSFQRQLNLYGFRRVTKGEDTGSYYHPKFQRGRRDLISEIKRLPGKAPQSHDAKIASAIEANSGKGKYNPTASNVLQVYDSKGTKPVSVSKLTANINGMVPIKPSGSTAMEPPSNATNAQSRSYPPQSVVPAYVSSGNAVHFLPVTSNPPLPTCPGISLIRESANSEPPPLLLRNFSVSSAFDEEYRLTSGEDGVISGEGQGVNDNALVGGSRSSSRCESSETAGNGVCEKPQPPVREESESWVKLGVLDSMPDMDVFDIETAFEE